jgi:hypothetical protein
LASWSSEAEQAEVEAYFYDYGVLLPGYHTFYWLGLNTTAAAWPAFTFLDGTPAPNTSAGTYAPWGNWSEPVFDVDLNATVDVVVPEPNNLVPLEYCVGANYSQLVNRSRVWPWADDNCNHQWPYMCEMLRECRCCNTIVQLIRCYGCLVCYGPLHTD